MNEFYVNSYSPVTIDVVDASGELVEPDGPIAIEVFDYDVLNEETRQPGRVVEEGFASQVVYGDSAAVGRYYYLLTPTITENPRQLRVSWSYEIGGIERKGSKTVFISVPYATLEDLRTIKELNEYSDEELKSMERLVSKIVDVFCGQSFGYEKDTIKTAFGQDSDFLWLPGRLWQLDEVSILDDYVSVLRNPEGDIIGKDFDSRSVREYVVLDLDNPWRIRNRRNIDYETLSVTRSRSMFKSGSIYAVRGNWGYPFVPIQITEAAKILVKTYFYDDATYRERYITTIRAGNWRMEFQATGDETTGSANADMILTAYKNINAAVI
jgi:hypothetical protein